MAVRTTDQETNHPRTNKKIQKKYAEIIGYRNAPQSIILAGCK